MTTKQCRTCGIDKPAGDFYEREGRQGRRRLSTDCRLCTLERSKVVLVPRPCEQCGETFLPKRKSTTRFCSARCTAEASRRRHGQRPLAGEPVVDGHKRCTKCGEVRPVEQFPTRRDRDNQPRSHCTLCGTEAARRPEARAKAREARYRRKYGIGVADFEALLADQAGRCAICSRTLTPENWHVDHDHEDGRVRGVLCDLCNKGLGQFKDNVGNLVSAIEYLRRHA